MAKLCKIISQKREPKFSTRRYNRCQICGRPRAYYRKFQVCRICLRTLISNALVPGAKKASW